MELNFSDSLIPKLFPSPDVVVTRKVTICQQAKARLLPKAQSLEKTKKLMAVLIGLGLLVEFAIGFIFNDRLVSGNLTEDLTIAEQVLRGAGAFGMVFAIMAVVFLVHVTFKASVQTPYRIAAAIAAVVTGVGLYLLAASIGNQVFSSIFEKLWSGEAAPGFAFDVANADPKQAAVTTPVPLGLRVVVSAALFIGVALFVSLCEIFWLLCNDRLASAREVIGEADEIIAIYSQANEAKTQAIQAEQQHKMLREDGYRRNFAHTRVMEGKQLWRNTVRQLRPEPMNNAALPPEQYQERKARLSKLDKVMEEADAAEAKQDIDVARWIDEFVLSRPASATQQSA